MAGITRQLASFESMEYMNKDTKLIIPTKNVYFFIEKIPLNYAVLYSGSGQSISKKAASQSLPNSGGINYVSGGGKMDSDVPDVLLGTGI